jgi:hypothetical protein
MAFGMDREFYNARRRDHASFSCPAGHAQHYTAKSESERLKDELENMRGTAKWYEDAYARQQVERQRLQRVVSAKKGTITKLKKRAANGVCPCCTRTFANVARHMATKHPGFPQPEPALPESSIEGAP